MATHDAHFIVREVVFTRMVANNDAFETGQVVRVTGAMVDRLLVMPIIMHGSFVCQHLVALSIEGLVLVVPIVARSIVVLVLHDCLELVEEFFVLQLH